MWKAQPGARSGTRIEIGLALVHIEPRRADPVFLQRPDQGRGIKQGAATGVDQHRGPFHQPQRAFVDRVAGFPAARQVKADRVRAGEQLVEFNSFGSQPVFRSGLGWREV